jgi:hypothetical protein
MLLWALFVASVVMLLNIIATSVFERPRAPEELSETAAVGATIPDPLPPPVPQLEYIEVTDSCGPYHESACVVARTGPGEEYPVVQRLRIGMVLRTSGTIENNGRFWYKIIFDEWVRFPDRIGSKLYVAAEYVTPLLDPGPKNLEPTTPTTSKRIMVDRSEQTLYAYDGDTLFMQQHISTGLEFTPTPRGTFTVYRKTPSRYMQGPLPGVSDQYYDLPGVPWNLYFTQQGAVIHGAYWHDNFGKRWSHGCVNVPPAKARELYQWADLGMQVTVRD